VHQRSRLRSAVEADFHRKYGRLVGYLLPLDLLREARSAMIDRVGRPARKETSRGQRRAVCLARDPARVEANVEVSDVSVTPSGRPPRDEFVAADLVELDYALARACARARSAYRTIEPWPDRVRASLAALLELFDEEPRLARVCVMDSMTSGSAAAGRRKEVVAALIGVIDEGRDSSRGGTPPPYAAEGVLAGALGAIHGRLAQPDPEPLIELLHPLMSFIVLPYRGALVARAELDRPSGVRSRGLPESTPPVRQPVWD
jgi:hypothetical protein